MLGLIKLGCANRVRFSLGDLIPMLLSVETYITPGLHSPICNWVASGYLRSTEGQFLAQLLSRLPVEFSFFEGLGSLLPQQGTTMRILLFAANNYLPRGILFLPIANSNNIEKSVGGIKGR